MDFLIDLYFQGVNRLFVLLFENESQKAIFKRYYLSTREITNYNVMSDGKNFFDKPVRKDLITYILVWYCNLIFSFNIPDSI